MEVVVMNSKKAAALLIACVVSGSALWVIANRPAEPKAEAATEPQTIVVPEDTIYAEAPVASPAAISVEDLPKVAAPKHRGVAGVSRKGAKDLPSCASLLAHNHGEWRDNDETVNGQVLATKDACDSSKL